MLVEPKRRQSLKYKEIRKLNLDENKVQLLYILEYAQSEKYIDLVDRFDNDNIEVIVLTKIPNFKRDTRFKYFDYEISQIFFEICEISYDLQDIRCLHFDLKILQTIEEINNFKPVSINSNKDEVSIIISHSNTDEKNDILSENIDCLKKQGQKIILCSHIPVSDDIVSKVDYFTYDKKNEMISHTEFDGVCSTFIYAQTEGYYHEYYYDNHAFAALKLMIAGINIASINGFKVSHLIHYDCVIYDFEILKNHYEILKEYDICHYFYQQHPERLDANFFSVNTDIFLKTFSAIREKSNYAYYKLSIFEEFLHQLSYKSIDNIFRLPIEKLFYKNIIDKFQMLNVALKKKYGEIEKLTHVIPSIDINGQKYLTIFTEDENVDRAIINGKTEIELKVNGNIFSVDDEVFTDGLKIEIPSISGQKFFDNDSRFAKCIYCIPEKIENFSVINKDNELVFDKNNFITTIDGEFFSLVHRRCFDHTGVIIDLGCLNWDWSELFFGKKKIIGADPQGTEIYGATLFKGAVSDISSKGRLVGLGETATVEQDEFGFEVLSWKDFTNRFEIDSISVLKINIEGGEFKLLKSMTSQDFQKIDQIAVSFHYYDDPQLNQETVDCLSIIQENGFQIFDLNIWGWYLCVKKID